MTSRYTFPVMSLLVALLIFTVSPGRGRTLIPVVGTLCLLLSLPNNLAVVSSITSELRTWSERTAMELSSYSSNRNLIQPSQLVRVSMCRNNCRFYAGNVFAAIDRWGFPGDPNLRITDEHSRAVVDRRLADAIGLIQPVTREQLEGIRGLRCVSGRQELRLSGRSRTVVILGGQKGYGIEVRGLGSYWQTLPIQQGGSSGITVDIPKANRSIPRLEVGLVVANRRSRVCVGVLERGKP